LYDHYDCNVGYKISADKVAKILKLATEVNDPKWTTKERVHFLVSRCNNGSVYSYNSIVSFLHSHGWIDDAFLIFDRMKEESVSPNVLSFDSVINCYIARKDFANAGGVIEDIRKTGLTPTLGSYATLFKGLVDNQQPLGTVKIFLDDMRRDKVDPKFVAEIEQLLQAGDSAGLSHKCADAIHLHLEEVEAQAQADHGGKHEEASQQARPSVAV